jgi:DNA-binding NtrC family response regulator
LLARLLVRRIMTLDSAAALIGRSEAIRALQQEIDLAARSHARVLVTGETGVGKEVVARLIHAGSPRRHAPLVAVNCAGVPDTLLETELFGHVRGSFTGAVRDRSGLLAHADGGTILLDEVGEMTRRMQAAFLRFLETGELQRIGDTRPTARVDVRVISATNRDLSARIASGDFREDLFYRLNVIHLRIPPLRERREDVPDLLDHFLAACAVRLRLPRPDVAPAALRALCDYDWPGNVRQLVHVVERLVLRGPGRLVGLEDLPPELRGLPSVPAEAPPTIHTLTGAVAHEVLARMTERGETFWTAVSGPFLARDLTRDVLRRVVELALERAHGRFDKLGEVVNVPPAGRKRLLAFLRKYGCLPSGQSTRAGSDGSHEVERDALGAASLV